MWTQRYIFTINLIGSGSTTDYSGTVGTCSSTGLFVNSAYKRLVKRKGKNVFEKCGTTISESCEGAEIPMSEEGWQQFCDEIVDGS